MPYWLWPNSCNPCNPCGGRGEVLVWQKSGDSVQSGSFTQLIALLEVVANVDTEDNWTGDINDYSLIIFIMPTSDPVWWNGILTGWTGRIHLVGEFNSFNASILTYMNGKTADTGMTIGADEIDVLCQHEGSVEAAPLTVGVSELIYAFTNSIGGGTALSKTGNFSGGGDAFDTVWLASNKLVTSGGEIDWVYSGDSNHLENGCTPNLFEFVENLFTVSV